MSNPISPRASWLPFRSPFPKESPSRTPNEGVDTPSLIRLSQGLGPDSPSASTSSDEPVTDNEILPLPQFPAPQPPTLGVHDNQRVGQLVDVWGQLRSVFSKRKISMDKLGAAKALVRSFVSTYNPRWSMWNHDLIPTLWDGSEHADKPPVSSIPPLDSTLVRSLVRLLKEYTVALSQAVATASQSRISTLHPLSLEFPPGLEIVCLFSILSRAYCNIQELCSEDDTIYCFSKLIKLVTVCLTSLPDVQGKGNVLESPDIYLQVLLGYSFRTMEYLLSRDHGWKRFPYESAEGKSQIQQADDEQCYSARINMQHIGSLIILLKKTIELLAEQGASVGFSGSRYHLLCHILNLLGALSFRNPPVASKMLESGLVEALLTFLPGLSGPWFSLTEPQTIFNIQLLVFQVLGFSFGPAPELAFRFANSKGWQKFFNFLRWTLQSQSYLSSLPVSHPYLQFPVSSSNRAYLPSVQDCLPIDSEADQTFLSQFFRPIDVTPPVTLPLPPPHPSAATYLYIDLLMKTLSVVCTNTVFTASQASAAALSQSAPCPSEHLQEESKGSIRRFFSRRRDTSSDQSLLNQSESSSPPSTDALDSKDVVPSESLGPLYSFSYAALRQFLLFLIGDPFEAASSGESEAVGALYNHPSLGFAFIRLLCDLIHHNPTSAVQLFHRISLWQSLSACFFSTHLPNPPPPEYMLFIEHHLILLRCVATIPGMQTVDEIDSLLEWISRHSDNYPLLYQLIQSLSKILDSNIESTCQSLQSSRLLQVFTPLLKHLRTLQASPSALATLKEPRAVIQRVHFAAMGFLTRLFDVSPENALHAATSDAFLEEFFLHYLNPDLRRYLRPLLTSMLKLCADKFSETSKSLLAQSGSTVDLPTAEPSTSMPALKMPLHPSASMPTVSRGVDAKRSSFSRGTGKSKRYTNSYQPMYLKIFKEYLQFVVRIHQQGNYEFLYDMFRICTMVIEEPSMGSPEPSRAGQRCFRDANGIQTFLNMLSLEQDPERLPQLCISIFRLLLALLRANPKSKEKLRSLGTDYLHNLLRRCLDADSKGILATSLPLLLLSLLVDGEFDGETRPLFQNPDILPLIIRLCEHLPPAQSCRLLDLITPLFEKYTLNKSIGCQIRLIFVLLGMVPRLAEKKEHQIVLVKLMFLVQILGTYSIRVSELKRIFHLLKTLPRPGPDSPLILLLGALHNMALCKNSGPDVFFNFDGGKSGLQLPVLERLPQHGYTFTTWIRVESFEDPTGAPKFQPRLFSFLNRQGMGIEAWFSDKLVEQGGRHQHASVLTISCIGSNGKPYHITFDQYLFRPLIWTCVSICHSNNTRFPWKDSDCKLYIDGQLRQKVALKYPVLTQPLDLCCIGSNAEVQSSRLLLYRESSFYGQIGTIYMFDDVLTQTHLKAIYSLGPNYSSTFQHSDISLFESQASRSSFKLPSILFDGTIASKLLLCYNCKAQEGKLILDNHPERVNSNAEFQMHAKILGSLNSCNTHDVSNQISCLGGISVLLPLFSHLDICFSSSLSPGDIELAQLLLVQILSVLRETLISSEVNQMDIVRVDGFAIISLLLRRASPELLSSSVLQTLQEFVAQIRLPELAQQAYNNLFFDFRIWIRTKPSLQQDLITMLLNFVKSSQYIRRLLPIQTVLDVIRMFYWDRVPVNPEYTRHYFGNDPLQRTIRPDATSLTALRQSLIKILSVHVNYTVNPEELIRPFYGFFLDCPDRVLLTELLTFFLQLIIEDTNGFRTATASYFGSIFFLLMLDNFDEKIRLLCLRMLAYLIPSTVTSNLTSDSSADLHATVASTDQPSYFGSNLAQRVRRSKRDNQFAYADRILVTFPYTSDTIRTLFAILVGSPLSDSIELSDDLSISNPSILPLIFRMLLAGDVSHCLSALQDLYLLLSNNYANRSAFLQCRLWQRWLFDLLTNPQLYSDGTALLQVIHDLIFNIFRILFIHQILYEKIGWRIIDQTYCILVDYGQRGLLHPERTIKLILKRVYPALLSEAEKLQNASKRDASSVFSTLYQKSSSPLLMNLIHSLIKSIQFVIFQPGNAPARRTDAQTSDDSSTSQANTESPESRLQRTASENWLFSVPLFSSLTFQLDLDSTETPDIRPRTFVSNLGNHFLPEKKTPIAVARLGTPSPQTPDFVPRDSGEGTSLSVSHSVVSDASPEPERLNPNLLDRVPLGIETAAPLTDSTPIPAPSSPLPQFWQDEQFAIHLTDLIARLDIFNPDLAYNSELRTVISELSLLSLLLSVNLLEHDSGSSSSVAHIIRKLVQSDVLISSQLDIVDSRLQFVLHRFLQVLALPQIESIREKTCVIVAKYVFRRLLPMMSEYVDPSHRPELEELADRGTLATLRAAFGSAPPEKWEILLRYLRIMANQFLSVDLPLVLDPILKQRRKVYETVIKLIAKLDKRECSEERVVTNELRSLREQLLGSERARRMALITSIEEHTDKTNFEWRNILRNLTNERGPWGTKQMAANVHWKLDKTENFSRMRVKLRRNYKFDPHLNKASDYVLTAASAPSLSFAGVIKMQQDYIPDSAEPANEAQSSDMTNMVSLSLSVQNDLSEDPQPLKPQTLDETTQSFRILLTVPCQLITPLKQTPGEFQITTNHLTFRADSANVSDEYHIRKTLRWPLDEIREVHLRRYRLRRTALEIFFVNQTNAFFNFNKTDRNRIFHKIVSLRPTNLVSYESGSPEEILAKSGLIKEWQQKQISNFEYLMRLNTIAGRTYNDLSQYPIFPWVIADYESPTLDLNDPKVYRDLTKPIGALNPQRLNNLLDRYNSWCDPDTPKFLYGSHYSTSGSVLYYLLRMEPFTTYALALQGDKFDRADRLFDSIAGTWNNVLVNPSDVKELIPEFFYMPGFLMNSNGFDFGTKQSGLPLGDVTLPPWASSPEEFVRINRIALESDYVTQHLPAWIDLIFGFKQRGKEAELAHNVFYFMTYEGAVDLDAIEDEVKRSATEDQIEYYGQTPAQLLRRPHPSCDLRNAQARQPIFSQGRLLSLNTHFVPVSNESIIFIGVPGSNLSADLSAHLGITDRLVTVDRSRMPGAHRWALLPGSSQCYTCELDSLLATRRRIGLPFASDIFPSSSQFAVTNDGKMILSCGHWDNTFKFSLVENSRLVQSVLRHKDVVTCLALGSDGKTLITGSKDTTLIIWKILTKGGTYKVDEMPLHILCGHNDEVTCVDLSVELDVSVSGSKDGTAIIHTLRKGVYVRSIYNPSGRPFNQVCLSGEQHIVLYSRDDGLVRLYSINGKLLETISTPQVIFKMICTKKYTNYGEYLITGSHSCIEVRTLYNLQLVWTLDTDSEVRELSMTSDERHLLVGLKDGKMLIIAPKDYFKA